MKKPSTTSGKVGIPGKAIRWPAAIAGIVASLGLMGAGSDQAGKSPDDSLRSIRVAPGFRVELVASEPLVKDPIAFDWSADGRLWVVEMGDYPLGVDGHGKPGGVVRVLEDTNHDGKYDRAIKVIDGLGIPSGIMAWREGVLIASAPEIVYVRSPKSTGPVESREVLFSGFVEGNPQHRVNGFEMGLDGWIYGANGDSGGMVRSVRTGQSVSIRGRDFRFRPDSGEFETESGQTQYGRHRDDWGHWFGNNNPNWGWHFVLADRELRRNPYFAAPDPRQTLERETRLYPISPTLPRFNDPGAANHVTSANSPTPYRDDLFGPEFATTLFVSEPVHNLVHRMMVEPDGATFRGRRAAGEERSEFLASSDPWFRPTMMKTGPDGALWIADMYRAVIEHPEWIPDDWEKRLDLRAGSEQGRIYRVFPTDRSPRSIPRLDRLDAVGLVSAMESPNGWTRDTAQRLLLDRREIAAIPALRALVKNTRRPQTRVQAIWTLADLDALDEDSALVGLNDPDARVREAIIGAVADRIPRSSIVAETLLKRADDLEARVRLRVAIVLGDWDDHRAGEALARLAIRDGRDPWIRAAILSSALPHMPALLAGTIGGERAAPPEFVGPMLTMLGSIPGGGLDLAASKSIGRPAGQGERFAAWQYAALAGLLTARDRSKGGLPVDLDLPFRDLWASARRIVRDQEADEGERIGAVSLLRHAAARDRRDRDELRKLLVPQTPVAVQEAAIAALGLLGAPEIADDLLAGWKQASPRIRSVILDGLLSRALWTDALVAAIESGRVAPAEVTASARDRLTRHRDPRIRQRSETVFGRSTTSRQSEIDRFRPALAMKGDPTAGAPIFRRLCITCHRLDQQGIEVGPDLATIQDRSPEALLTAILDPNRAVEAKYLAFAVATVDGRVFSGIITSETASSVRLRRPDGQEVALLRSEIEEMGSVGRSLMPEGLERDLAPRDLADLIAYINAQPGSR